MNVVRLATGYAPNYSRSVHALAELEGHLRVDEKVLKTIVFVGKAGEASFIAHGTGFVTASIIEEHGFQAVVTARHVIESIQSDLIDIRINTHAGGAKVLSAPKSDWVFHEDDKVDVAVCPSVINPELYDVLHMPLSGDMVLSDKIIEQKNIGVGDDIFMAGMYVARLGEVRNIPIVRCGTIAAMPSEKLQTAYGYHHAYLIEARSIDGLSGSPVYIQIPPWRADPNDGLVKMQHGLPQHFLGMVLGHNQVENPNDTIVIKQKAAGRPAKKAVKASVPLNTGIGIVLPISYIIEAVEQPRITDKRLATLAVQRQRTFKADSATISTVDEEVAAGDRGRFNRLLGAAVKPPKEK